MFSVAVLLAGGAAAVRGQSALDGSDPNANAPVLAAVVQPDGKILIGGSFTTVLGVTRNRIARLNTDGTLDVLPASTIKGDGGIIQTAGTIDLDGGAMNRGHTVP